MASGQLTSILRRLRQRVDRPDGAAVSDRQLLRCYAESGDGAAFATLVDRHGALVLGVGQRLLGNRHDAEDVFQAVFVVLARKAGAAGWQESVGPWLHQVAQRVALKARGQALRRQAQERKAAAMRPADVTEQTGADLRAVLDDELGRLPAKYRAPLLLCYLEGKSNDEAAAQLGWPAGTVKSRLSRGRDLLRNRLTQRGIVLSTEVLILLLAQEASAAVPAALREGVVYAALQVAAGQAIGGLSGPAAVLAKGALRDMAMIKLGWVAAVVLLVGTVVGVGWLGIHLAAAEQAADDKKAISLPRDPRAVVVAVHLAGGMIANKTPDPYLQVLADGSVTVTDRSSGAKKETKLTPQDVQDLLRFIVQDKELFKIADRTLAEEVKEQQQQTGIGIGVGDGLMTRIVLQANDRQHEVKFYAARAYAQQYPKAKALGQFVAVEQRLLALAASVPAGK